MNAPKMKIEGSAFSDTDLKNKVCSHLQPILDALIENGNSFDQASPMQTDKGGGWTRIMSRPIDFHLVEEKFDIPKFIELHKNTGTIFCSRCWCDIASPK